MPSAAGEAWYWCVRHRRVEQGESCPADDRIGPYPSEDAARNWRQQFDERNDRWDAEDKAWTGDEDG